MASLKKLRAARKKVVARRKALYRAYKKNRYKRLEKRRSLLRRFRSRKEQAKRLARRIKRKERRGLPSWLPTRFSQHWRHPYGEKARSSSEFRNLIWARGYASPNFTELETRCNDGTRVPASLRNGCQDQAFRLEQVRHDLGDKSIPSISWFRPESYNRLIGGATQSTHIKAIATDFSKQTVGRFGSARFDQVMNHRYANDGFGTYPAGSRHGDVRGFRSRWSSF